ncbi:MAG: 3-deoxy-manno-octulosonate cytidylyltransferase [Treponema sp.]|jgi:3-deoxy-manno-octulosonate cytidylyltransferase (CMP-KDO synthetase)|nr:3-deoxy-manno-octulosonate cytidylyltransferase [Treponema sp.]
MNIVAVIPARYESSRFQGKPLQDICGKRMIERVYLQARQVTEFEQVYVATDDDRIYTACIGRDIPCIMTSVNHKTGTDRVGEVAEKIPADLYVNIQGDEPLIEPATIRAAITPFIENPHTPIHATNLMTRIHDPVDLINVTVPKVIVSRDGRGVYLTRSAAPFPKSSIEAKYYKQVCVYGFTPESLRFYCNSPRGAVESIEDIEILRFIEAGYHVHYIEVDSETIAVDTPKDLERVVAYMKEHNIS